MRFEISEQIRTRASGRDIINALEIQFKKISSKVERRGENLAVRGIEASFGSINRYDLSIIQVQRKEGGFLCVADVTYRPSGIFWVFFIIGLFFYFLLWWPPIIFYLIQRKTVRSAIADVFARIKNEFELAASASLVGSTVKVCPQCRTMSDGRSHFCISCGHHLNEAQKATTLESLERLTALKEKGALSEVEFENEKRKVLGQSSHLGDSS